MSTALPTKVRVTRLAESQLSAVVALEAECTAMYHAHGLKDVPARGEREVAALTKRHNVRVAEADDKVAGYVAWRDESPGVAYIEELSVHPEHQRQGIATRLLETVRDEARALRLPYVLLRTRKAAPWAAAFWKKAGFSPLEGELPDEVRVWKDEQTADGSALTVEGEVVLWAKL